MCFVGRGWEFGRFWRAVFPDMKFGGAAQYFGDDVGIESR